MRESDRIVGRPPPRGYETFYRDFDSPLMSAIRREAYGEDIGQHSWVAAEELRRDILRLRLSPSSRFLDLAGQNSDVQGVSLSGGIRGVHYIAAMFTSGAKAGRITATIISLRLTEAGIHRRI